MLMHVKAVKHRHETLSVSISCILDMDIEITAYDDSVTLQYERLEDSRQFIIEQAGRASRPWSIDSKQNKRLTVG